MFRNNYDNDSVTFSPQGRIFQVEYAQEAVKQGSVVVGIVSKTHAVLAAVKVRGSVNINEAPLTTLSVTPKSSHRTRRRSSPSTHTLVSPLPVSPPMPAFSPTS
jgi:hypothetical protein